MNYSDKNYETLKEYEPWFRTAVYSSWARNIGATMLDTLRRIFEETTGRPYPMRGSCGTCQLHLLQDAGTLYFQDKEERGKVAAESIRRAVAENAEKKNKAPRKVAVSKSVKRRK